MDKACYIHASLHRFTAVGASTVVKYFTDGALRVGVDRTLWDILHDGESQIFSLICHNTNGLALDDLLREVIDRYTTQELEDANEEDRPAQVEPFGEGLLADAFDDDMISFASNEPVKAREILNPIPRHVVQYDGTPLRNKVAATQLLHLPIQLKARLDRAMQSSVTGSLCTVHASQWSAQGEAYRYSGALGAALMPLRGQGLMDFAAILDELTSFPELERLTNIRKEPKTPPYAAPAPSISHWDFVGEQPRTDQWLVGMGQTVQLDPDAAPEPSRDAIRFHQIDTQAQATSGRIRMPQGISVMPILGEDKDDEPEQTLAQLNSDFTALLGPPTLSDEESQESAEDTDSDKRPGGIAISGQTGFAALFSKGQKSANVPAAQVADPSSALTRSVPQIVSSDSGSTADSVPQGSVPAASSLETPATLDDSFPIYDRRYANVDSIGLTGDAANQAKWELENLRPTASISTSRPLRTKDQLMLARHAGADPDSSLRDAVGLSRLKHQDRDADRRPALHTSSLTPATYADTKLGGDELWAYKLVAADVRGRTGHLVDTSDVALAFRVTTEQFPALPSSSAPATRLPRKHAMPKNQPQVWHAEQGDNSQPSLAQVEGLLVDVSESPATSATSTVKLPQKALTPKVLKDADHEHVLDDRASDSDTVVERMKPDVGTPSKRRTMKQQAKKGTAAKGKARKPSVKSKVVLELPDPLPKPKAKKVLEPVQFQAAAAERKSGLSDGECKNELQGVFNERVSQQLLTQDVDAAPGLLVQFGIALLDQQHASTSGPAIAVADMQRLLDRDTAISAPPDRRGLVKFLSSLCTAHQDAAHLLSLPGILSSQHDRGSGSFMDAWCAEAPWDLRCEIFYEVEVTDVDKVRWLIVVRSNDGSNVNVSHVPQEPSAVYVQYPHHVWDARIQLHRTEGPTPTTDFVGAAKTFAKTFNTLKEAKGIPAIEADVPDIGELPAFMVQRVVAKRCFSQAIPLKSANVSVDKEPDTSHDQQILATWVVSQVWDLILQFNDALDGEAGLLAVAGTEAEMLERGRLWWETSLELKDGLCKSTAEPDNEQQCQTLHALERLLGEIVGECGLDNIGLGQYYGMDMEDLAEVLQPARPPRTKGRNGRGTGKGRVRAAIEEDAGYIPFW
ncbi:hypothetical protein LTR95_002655 [Oleoguttula sp. CCFEE 5521]